MKALVLGQYVNYGGTQYLAYQVIDNLKRLGFKVDLVTGKENNFLPKYHDTLIATNYPYFKVNSRTSILRNVKHLQKELKGKINDSYDISFNNHPNTFLYKADINFLHGPSFIDSLITLGGGLKKNALFYLIKYGKIYKTFDGAFFLTHGKYTKRISEKYLPSIGVRPKKIEYIYTPVKTDFSVDLYSKKKTVLVFGRIMPDKQIEFVLRCAERTKVKFIISGFLGKDQVNYLNELIAKKPDNVEIIPNPDDNTKRKLYESSWTYFHPKPMEHFGVSAAEAISFGCVPVVPKNGGIWEDVTESGEFGLGYSDLGEASEKILESLDLKISRRMEIYKSRYRFSYTDFERKFECIVQDVLKL